MQDTWKVRVGVKPLEDGYGGFEGLPPLDAAFDPFDDMYLYIVPVLVTAYGVRHITKGSRATANGQLSGLCKDDR